MAAAYDRYAAALYGYCRWMLPDPGHAASALLATFVTAATLDGLKDTGQLRAFLYAAARSACYRQMRTAGAGFDEVAGEARCSAGQAEMRRLVRATLADLKHGEHEVIELSLRHNLDVGELAAVLEVSWSRAHALAERARDHLEKALGALLIAHTERQSCPELGASLAGWDGWLTVQIGKLTARHIEHCGRCAQRRSGALRPEVLSRWPRFPADCGSRYSSGRDRQQQPGQPGHAGQLRGGAGLRHRGGQYHLQGDQWGRQPVPADLDHQPAAGAGQPGPFETLIYDVTVRGYPAGQPG